MKPQGLLRHALQLSLGSGFVTLMAWGCTGSTDEKLEAARLAQGCSINSDCQDPLICAFERCHTACAEDRDCPGELRCVRGPTDEVNVCQLPDEVACEVDKDCPGLQVCGVDDECRDPCSNERHCTKGQLCANSGQCASTLSSKDSIDEAGNIVPDQHAGTGSGGAENNGNGGSPGSGATGGTSIAGNAGGSSGSGQSGGSGGSESSGGSEGVPEGGNGGEPALGSGGVTGEGGTGPGTGGYVEDSSGVESVENGDRDHTVPLTSTASILLTTGDEDWFSVTAPDDGRAHVIELALSQEAGLMTTVRALAGDDFAQIGTTSLAQGVKSTVYVSVGPGTTTLLQFLPYASSEKPSGKRVDLSLTLSAENDEHEPNNTRQTATTIPLDTSVTAQLMNPFVSAIDQAAVDWYRVELAQGTATLSLESVPSVGQFRINRVNQQGVSVIVATTADGQSGDFQFSAPTAGTYDIEFVRYSASFAPFAQGAKPAYMSESYTFRVQQ